MTSENKVGSRVRDSRSRLGMSVWDLSNKSGISSEIIEGVESGRLSPAVGVMTKIAHALGLRLGTFMDDQYTPDPVVFRPAGSAAAGPVAIMPLAVGKGDRALDPMTITLAPGADTVLSSHEGEEFIYVLEGEVELVYGGETTALKAGESATYNSVVKHVLKAPNGAAKVLAVVYQPV